MSVGFQVAVLFPVIALAVTAGTTALRLIGSLAVKVAVPV